MQMSEMTKLKKEKSSFLLILLLTFLDIYQCESTDNLSTVEPEAAPGCNAPDLRFSRPRKDSITTEAPFAQFETTQIYLPEDFTTADIEFVENIDGDSDFIGGGSLLVDGSETGEDRRHKYAEVNPYRTDGDLTGDIGGLHDDDDDEEDDFELEGQEAALIQNANQRRQGKRRRFTGGKRRRVEKEHGGNGGGGRGGRGRFERHALYKRQAQDGIEEQDGDREERLSASGIHVLQQPQGKIYYIESVDLLSASFLNKTMKRAHRQYTGKKAKDKNMTATKEKASQTKAHSKSLVAGRKLDNEHDDGAKNKQIAVDIENDKDIIQGSDGLHEVQKPNGKLPTDSNKDGNDRREEVDQLQNVGVLETISDSGSDQNQHQSQDVLQRVKRKSGKTTGALSRPKGGGDSSSKSTSRKDKAGGVDEGGGEGNYAPVSPESSSEEEEEEKSSESSEVSHFGQVSEIRFPGEVGPLGDRRLCKIRCVKGKWVGPLCATNEEDEHGNVRFQPLYKSCQISRVPPHLLLSYRNISVNVGWDLPHGHSLQARCKDLGLYKLLGESRVLCSNGLWAPRMPNCVPTTLLTNYSDDSPPSIRIKIGVGSGAFEPSGVLAVLPGSTIHLDCMYPRRRGTPEWTWTGWFNQYYTGWSTIPEEKGTKYRLTIKDIQNQDSGTYTCASPRGLTNSIVIVVATSQCPQLPESVAPLSLRLEGNKLGQRALYRCPLGYRIEGTVNSTCLASGNWSSPPPTCQSVQCPPLFLEDPHLSLTELNTSAWGRAVFKCSWGFKLSGPPGLECEPSGTWSGPVPRCRAIQCPQPLVPINGRIDGTSGSSSHRRYAVGALVTFSCTEGHLLVGEASIVCTETGFWSHPPPFCKSQCPYPGDPPNGLIAPLKFHYDPGDLLSVQCRPGFVEYGTNGLPERPRCLPDGNWSGSVPQCRNYEEV